MIAISLLENIQRQNLSFADEVRGYQAFYEANKPISLEDLSQKMGKDVEKVSQRLALSHLPTLLRKAVECGILDKSQAERLRHLPESHEEVVAVKKRMSAAYAACEVKKVLREKFAAAKAKGLQKELAEEVLSVVKEVVRDQGMANEENIWVKKRWWLIAD